LQGTPSPFLGFPSPVEPQPVLCEAWKPLLLNPAIQETHQFEIIVKAKKISLDL
jgi:hypothetical protein